MPVLGAGISRGAGLPDAGQLATWLRPRVPFLTEPAEDASLFALVDAIDPSQMSSLELQTIVAEHIASLELTPSPFVSQLVNLPSRLIVTLNYDDLLGFAADQQGIVVRRLSMLDEEERDEAHRLISAKDWPPPELTVVHLHGQASYPRTLVLGGESYNKLMRLRETADIVYELAHHRTLAFLGTSLDEPYLLAELQQQQNSAFHVVLCREDDVPGLTTGRAAISRRQHLEVVGYPDHGELVAFARWVTTPQPERGPAEPTESLSVDKTPRADTYVASEFVDRALPADAVPVDESAIGSGHRTLVVGSAGSGKTHLVTWLAANASDDKPAVRIRLADVPARPGLPEKILHAWSSHARTAADRPHVDVSASALRDDRLHFLLDGLDEVANESQSAVAELINQIATRFPQHAFTVTSRPIPALTTFGDPNTPEATPWQRVELAPGAAWQERFLAARGIVLSDLEAAMPALSDMRDLLYNPFLLSHTVELFEDQALGGLRDVGDLLSRLVDMALEREEEQLPMLDVDDARAWLRRVALAAQIAGRRTFGFDELHEIPVAEGLVGNMRDLVHQLQLRLLLIEEDGRLRFSHRYIADELAAESLAEIAPSEPLLDALVPVVDAELAGVRDDALIAVTLTCLRSSAWREAVAARDPLAAARATPTDAPDTERVAAVDLLWDTYEEWRIWNWDREVPDLVEDAEVLARLLRADPGGPAVAKIRRLIHEGDYVQQGNAIHVLARVGVHGLAEDLRTVLRDPGRNGVVIREAAISAANLNCVVLVDDIVAAMIGSQESVVQQDCSIALRRLVPDEDLLDVATRLARGKGEDASMFASLVKERLTPGDRITLSQVLAVERIDTFREDKLDLSDAIRSAKPTAGLVSAAACAATLWRIDTEEIRTFLEHDPVAAAHGLLAARDHGAEWWDLIRLAVHVDLDTLRAAKVDGRVLERVAHQREIDAMTPEEREELRRVVEASLGRDARDIDDLDPPPLVLAELLRAPAEETNGQLNHRANELSGQVAKLEDCDREELRQRLVAMWPSTPTKDLIEVNGNCYTLKFPTAAWLFLAPAANVIVDDDQWAQLATTNAMRLTEQAGWLRRQVNTQRMRRAVERMETADVEAWLHLLGCCSSPPPDFVVEACLANVQAHQEETYHSRELASRLVDADATDGLRRWAARDPVAAVALQPMLAQQNDIDAQRTLVAELLDQTRSDALPSMDDVNWMASLRSPEFLPALFEVLEHLYPASGDTPTRNGPRSALNPTINAIQNIGTREAVRLFDALFERGDDRRWLRAIRDKVAANVIRESGDAAVPAASAALLLPRLLERDES